MSTSLTKKGLITASDKVIVAARPALEIISQFTTDFSDEAVKPGTGIAVDVLTATAETFDKDSANYGHATGVIKNFQVAYSLGGFAFNIVPGTLADLCGSYVPSYLIMLGFLLVCAAITLTTYWRYAVRG